MDQNYIIIITTLKDSDISHIQHQHHIAISPTPPTTPTPPTPVCRKCPMSLMPPITKNQV